MTIDLAPENKRGLLLAHRVMLGSGAVGIADPWPALLPPERFGAAVTLPVTWRARRGNMGMRLAEVTAGFVLQTGDQNPGYLRLLGEHSVAWARLPLPVLLSLSAHDAGHGWVEMARRADEDGAVAGLEIALEALSASAAESLVAEVRRATTLPLVVRVPATNAAQVASGAAEGGADALVIATTPSAAAAPPEGEIIGGTLGGPAAFPFTLLALGKVAALRLGIPLVAAGGIYRPEQAYRCLDLGAAAVQIRSLAWVDPAAAVRLSEAVDLFSV